MDARRRCIAGLAVRWRTIRAPRCGADYADGGERAFGLWVVDRDLDALVAEVTQAEFERYEQRNAPAVAAFLARHLEPGGEVWIADPGRPHAPRFLTLARQSGLELLSRETLAPPESATCREIALLRLRRPG